MLNLNRAIFELLREERQMRLKGGSYHQTQIVFAYNTNRIEGSRLTEEQTRYIYETRTINTAADETANVDDIIEMSNHFICFDYMLDNASEELSEYMIQPRTNVWRYRCDNRTHSHIGYNIFLNGIADGEERQFAVAISEKQQQAVSFRIGDDASGTGWTKKYPQWEYADYYRAGALKRVKPCDEPQNDSLAPPWVGELPDMETYEQRGCRVLSKACWKAKCFKCKWATMANVTIEYDWGIKQKWRFESFCYGPKSCKLYKRGADPMIPYKGCGSTPDSHGGLDEILTERRGWDE